MNWTWNWTAAEAVALTDFVFIAGLLLQSFWVEGTADRLVDYFSVDASNSPMSESKVAENKTYILERLSLDADRVQAAATLLTIPFAAILLLRLDAGALAALFAATLVVVGGIFGLLSRLKPEKNHFLKNLSWISFWSVIVLVVYTVVIPFVTPTTVLR
ncbi:MAG: hypothetical protein QOH69_2424 [Actinomycetota bacterium]|nr:hypothetical protein [Actinomycetota bacterium]